MYADRLTKEELIANGISEITQDGRVFRTGLEVQPYTNSNGYLMLNLYDRDSEGNYIKIPLKRKAKDCKNLINTYRFKSKTVGLHRAMWAWFHGEVPKGYVIDHINNSHTNREDYHLDNLQLLTPKENLAKERPESTKEVKCKLNKPREYYETKLNQYLEAYESAKIIKDAELAHKLRGNIANTKARLRYYDSHIDEVNNIKTKIEKEQKENAQMTEFKKDLMELKYWKERFKEAGNKTMWHQCCKVEKLAKTETKENAIIIVRHALDTLHGTFGGR